MTDRIKRDFSLRNQEEKTEFLQMTWCNTCMKEDLGMEDPQEYEIEGKIFIDGKCVKCHSVVTTELAFDDE
ncbi:hypothetical protein [Marinicellulosiphila megalodicopiae]|uniref:hypothetical protein n=1 Tax=Marinicellulosiphila megalodicopiae TaxID=2724896 RepID=UPI003BB0A107